MRLALTGLALSISASAAGAQIPKAPRTGEGPLRNDTFLPVHAQAESLLRKGDEELAAARAAGRAVPATVLDGWRAALTSSGPNDVVATVPSTNPAGWPDPGHTLERRAAAPTLAVLQRLLALEADGRSAWRERFAPLASSALSAAPFEPRSLVEIERLFPGTPSAALAALRLSDAATEAGRPERARAYLKRAEAHASLGSAPGTDWRAHIEHRQRSLGQPGGPLQSTGKWRLTRSLRLESRPGDALPGRVAPLGLGIQPSAATSPRGDLLIQVPRALIWFDAAALGAPKGGAVRLHPYSTWLDLPPERPFVPPAAGGWPLLPLRHAADVMLVVGRGRPARMRRDLPVPARGNHLVATTLDDNGDLEVHWTLSGPGLERPGIPTRLASTELGPGTWEFQPGPVRAAGALVVLARGLAEHNSETREGTDPETAGLLRLIGLDWATGERLWSTDLARASDLIPSDAEAVGMGTETQRISMPLVAQGPYVLVATHAGVLACVDATDGRLEWSVRNQRRSPDTRSWPASTRPTVVGKTAWIAPGDSDFAYLLPAGPASLPLFLAPPVARDTRLLFAGAWDGGQLFYSRSGRERAFELGQTDGSGVDLLYLGAEERFSGASAFTGNQALVATSRSFLAFSRENWTLEASIPLPDLGAGIGGNVVPFHGGAAVIGADTLWVLESDQ